MAKIGRVTVFCSASESINPTYHELASLVGKGLAERGLGLVYGGGRLGMMGRLADGALAAGGRVIGVIPRALQQREVAHLGLQNLEICDDLLKRKERLMDLGDAFLVLPGGLGTIDEFLEVITHQTLGYHAKQTVLLDINGFYTPLIDWLRQLSEIGFIKASQESFQIVRNLDEAFELFCS